MAKCVEIPEAISQDKTKEETLKNIEEAIETVLEWRQKKAEGKLTEMVEVTV